jgi:hypothetical protein
VQLAASPLSQARSQPVMSSSRQSFTHSVSVTGLGSSAGPGTGGGGGPLSGGFMVLYITIAAAMAMRLNPSNSRKTCGSAGGRIMPALIAGQA